MPAVTTDLFIEKGATYNKIFRWSQKGLGFVDTSLYLARMQIRETKTDGSFFLEMTSSNGGIILNETPGLIRLHLTATETTNLTNLFGVYDLEMQLLTDSENVRRLIQGEVEIDGEVTK